MSDWRSNPRTGKAQFMKHLDTIQQQLNAGETQNAIRQGLKDAAGLEISAAQFSRYVKTFELTASNSPLITATAKTPRISSTPEKKKTLTPNDLKKNREDIMKNTDWLALSQPVDS
ncbi:hypothetical protein ACTXN4_07380 [Pseudomonas helleri]|uniref:hypothetical protein n=1 Tax=Pseudomonas helleri TaxID=1608996 RepID=UPI003FD266E4